MSPAGFPGLGASTNWPQIYGIAVHIPLPERDPPGPPWADLLFAPTRHTAYGIRHTAYGSFVLRLRHGATREPTLLLVRAPAGPLLLHLMPDGAASKPLQLHEHGPLVQVASRLHLVGPSASRWPAPARRHMSR